MSMKRLAVMLEEEIHHRFKARVSQKGLDMSEVVRGLIERWLLENPDKLPRFIAINDALPFTEDPPTEPKKHRYVYEQDST